MNRRSGRPKGVFFSIKEFVKFIRLETCIYVSCMGMSGYLLFNRPDLTLLILFLAIFSATAAAYAYNHLTDREEDAINDRRLNVFVTNGRGAGIVMLMFGIGAFFALFLPPFSFLLFLLNIPVIVAYSRLRVKKIFLLKNVYTGMTMSFTFIIGACINGTPSTDMAYVFLFVFFIGCIGNLIGDIRGYKGDLASGAKTLPVRIGIGTSKRFVHFMLLGFSISILVSRYALFYPFVPFVISVSLFIALEKHRASRYCIILSFVSFFLSLYSRSMGGM
jgi:4-hydroxybenzoate polyprenyltransferase